LVRPSIEGKLVRWVSRVEEEVTPLTPPESPMSVASTSHGYVTPFRHSTSYTAPSYTIGPGQPPYRSTFTTTPSSPSPSAYASASSYPQLSPFPYHHSPSQPHISSTSSATRPLEPLPTIVQRRRKITKNYVVLENAQTEKAPRVTWKQTMEGMFGDHVRWEDVRVYSTKNRPMCEFFSCLLARRCVSSVPCQRVRGRDAQSQGWPRTTWTRERAFHTRMSLRSRRSIRSWSTIMSGTRNLDVTLDKKR